MKSSVSIRMAVPPLSKRAHRAHEGDEDFVHESRMEEPVRGPGGDQHHEAPASHTLLQAKGSSRPGTFQQNAEPLQKEISSGQAVAGAGRQRDEQIVNEAGDKESGQRGAAQAQASRE